MARIMIVDDNEDFLTTINSTLTELGNEVFTFTHPSEALLKALTWNPDVLVFNLCIPLLKVNIDHSMASLALAETMRVLYFKKVSIIAISSFCRQEIERYFPGKLREYYFFNKPLEDSFEEQLFSCVSESENIESLNLELIEIKQKEVCSRHIK